MTFPRRGIGTEQYNPGTLTEPSFSSSRPRSPSCSRRRWSPRSSRRGLNLSDPLTLRYYWRQWDSRQFRILIPATVAGVTLGVWVLSLLSGFWLKKTIGAAVFAFAAVQLALRRRDGPLFDGAPGPSVSGAFGVVAGLASTGAHSGGMVLGGYWKIGWR